MTTQNRLYSLEELEKMTDYCHRDERTFAYKIAKQLADTMRENERLREELKALLSSARKVNSSHYGEEWGNLDKAQNQAEKALSNKESVS